MNSILLITLVAVVALAIPVGAVLLRRRRVPRERVRLECPVRLRAAHVLFRMAPNGRRLDVLRCSIFGRRPLSCGKACIYTVREA